MNNALSLNEALWVLLLGGCWVGEVRSVGQLRLRVDPSAEALHPSPPIIVTTRSHPFQAP